MAIVNFRGDSNDKIIRFHRFDFAQCATLAMFLSKQPFSESTSPHTSPQTSSRKPPLIYSSVFLSLKFLAWGNLRDRKLWVEDHPSIMKGHREGFGERVKGAKAGSPQPQATSTFTARPPRNRCPRGGP